MEWLKRLRILVILAPGLILAIVGCAGKPVNKTLQAEEALGAAGFQLKMADTPAKLERIRKIPQKQVVRVMIKDREAYLWAVLSGLAAEQRSIAYQPAGSKGGATHRLV